ncbi:MAG TPA: HD domain-containing protein, partial [Candidatus Wallbacteria bacterium]|nr:HD domain-containing protein [Candidatus Wallbacteria bacterium]
MIITNSKAYTECFMQLANVLDLDEHRQTYHSWRVAAIAYKMGKLLNSTNLQEIFWSGLLHDIGAFGYNDFTVSTSDSISVLEKDKILN